MNDLPRNKYEILDLIFTFLIAVCISLTAILILSNLIISIIFVVVVVLFAFIVLFFWISRNPFNIYLIRAFAFDNFVFTFIAIMIFFSKVSPTLTDYPGYFVFLFPSGIYLLISYKFTTISALGHKRASARLAYIGRVKASQQGLFVDNMEERIKREELIAKQKKEYRYNLIIVLAIALTLSSFAALIFGFY